MSQKGQVILTLILIMTVALAIGLSIVQKSLVDVSTSTKIEQSARAFSAAEAGIEKHLKGDTSNVPFSDTIVTVGDNLVPQVQSGTNPQAPLTFDNPPLYKEEVAQVWFADYNSTLNPPSSLYKPTNNDVDVLWGSSGVPADKTAIEITIIYYNSTTSKYETIKKYYDDSSASRSSPNNFEQVTCNGANPFQCRKTISSLPTNLILLRARLLYNQLSQPFAIQARGICGANCSLPPQMRIIESEGTSGETRRKVRVSQSYEVVPPYFDYAIFSAGEINKR